MRSGEPELGAGGQCDVVLEQPGDHGPALLLGALVAGLAGAGAEAAVLAVAAGIVAVVGVVLGLWRASATRDAAARRDETTSRPAPRR